MVILAQKTLSSSLNPFHYLTHPKTRDTAPQVSGIRAATLLYLSIYVSIYNSPSAAVMASGHPEEAAEQIENTHLTAATQC